MSKKSVYETLVSYTTTVHCCIFSSFGVIGSHDKASIIFNR